MIIIVSLIVLSYFLGAVPSSLILGKLFKNIDIREHGSGNMGTTNTFRVLGKKAGFICLFYDMFKGAAVIILIKSFNIDVEGLHLIYFAIPAVLGHVFSIFVKFKGGKAVATSTGMALALTPIPTLIAMAIFIALLLIFGYVSLSSTAAALTVTSIVFLTGQYGIEENVLYSLVTVMILYKHRANYVRLLNGTESSVLKSKNKKVES